MDIETVFLAVPVAASYCDPIARPSGRAHNMSHGVDRLVGFCKRRDNAMSTTMTTDRGMTMGGSMGMSNMGGMMMMPMMQGMMMPGMMNGMMGMGQMNMPQMSMGGMNGMMLPRCTMKMEKCPGGMMMTCMCEDKTAAEMMKNMCMMMQGGMCSCMMMMNGMPMCCYNMGMMGTCKMEMMDMGCTMTCTSGDKAMEKMIQGCCDCMNTMMMPGMTCCMMMNGMPMCCCVC
jgi:hypothetical protein